MHEEWYIIINPRAGSGKTMAEWLPAEKIMKKMEIPYLTVFTERKGHATELAKSAAADGYRKLLAVGGDGSIHELYRGVMLFCDETGTDPGEFYIGVAPIGSGNDWIKEMRVPKNLEEVLRLMAGGSFGKMDVVRMENGKDKVSYMTNVGGIGFDSHVCERVNWQKEMGRRHNLIYLRALQYTVRKLKPVNIQVIADDKEVFSGPCYSLAMGNGRYSGGGMCQVPDARIDDGLLDFMIVPKVPVSAIFKEIPRLLRKNINESDKVLFFRCRTLHIVPLDSQSEDIFEVDGEIEGRLPMTVRVTGQQINALKG